MTVMICRNDDKHTDISGVIFLHFCDYKHGDSAKLWGYINIFNVVGMYSSKTLAELVLYISW
jgi:hypothetical protein